MQRFFALDRGSGTYRVAGPVFEPGAPRFSVRLGVLHRVAARCNVGIPRRFSLPRLAPRCGVLRARWCQGGVNTFGTWQRESLCTLPTCSDRASALARVISRASPSGGVRRGRGAGGAAHAAPPGREDGSRLRARTLAPYRRARGVGLRREEDLTGWST